MTFDEEDFGLEPGDVVSLCSGGPLMTVEEIDADHDGPSAVVACSWFDNDGRLQVGHFPLTSLFFIPTKPLPSPESLS